MDDPNWTGTYYEVEYEDAAPFCGVVEEPVLKLSPEELRLLAIDPDDDNHEPPSDDWEFGLEDDDCQPLDFND